MLPVLALALPIAAPIVQILIRNIEDVSTRTFVPVARAKGLSQGAVLWPQVLRNATLPTLAIAADAHAAATQGYAVCQPCRTATATADH